MENKETERTDGVEIEFDDFIRQYICDNLELAKDLPYGSDEWVNANKINLEWYKAHTGVHLESQKIINEDYNRMKDRGSAKEIETARSETENKKMIKEIIIEAGKIIVPVAVTGVGYWLFNRNQERIMAAEFCSQQYINDRNFDLNQRELLKMLERYNGKIG